MKLKSGDWLGAALDDAAPDGDGANTPNRHAWHVAAHDVSVVENAVLAPDETASHRQTPPDESALMILNERIDRMEGLIVGELAHKIQHALSEIPTKGDMTEAIGEAVRMATAEVAAQTVEPLLEAVTQLQAQHDAEIRRGQAEHETSFKELMRRFDGLGDEIAKQNALTDEQLIKLQERKNRWWWPK